MAAIDDTEYKQECKNAVADFINKAQVTNPNITGNEIMRLALNLMKVQIETCYTTN